MNLYDFTTQTSEDGERIVLASGCVADHADPAQRRVWIAFQVEIDVPTVRNGALLRQEVLSQVRDTLHPLEMGFEQIGRQGR